MRSVNHRAVYVILHVVAGKGAGSLVAALHNSAGIYSALLLKVLYCNVLVILHYHTQQNTVLYCTVV